MNIISKEEYREFVQELSQFERHIVWSMTEGKESWPQDASAVLRWALSLARVSKVLVSKNGSDKEVEIGHATNAYRRRLYHLLERHITDKGKIDQSGLLSKTSAIKRLARKERRELIHLFSDLMQAEDLDNAVRKRPLALALSGGGGTSYIFVGALMALQEAGIVPSAIAGTSMGAIIGAFRACHRDFEIQRFKDLAESLTFDRVLQPLKTGSKFGIPGTFRIYLREAIGPQFEERGKFLRIVDLEIPFRVSVAGLAHIEGKKELDLGKYDRLLMDEQGNILSMGRRMASISRAILDVAKRPLRSIFLGSDMLTREFDVLDAVGFSASVPGVLHYDILRDDKRMETLVTTLLKREGVFRLFDGGFVDNLPAKQAFDAVQTQSLDGRDPFVLALDGFAPNINRHWLFLPVMRLAAEKSREGREFSHLCVTFKKVLSPANIIPSKEQFEQVIKDGAEEMAPKIPFIRKMIGPIPDPPDIVTSNSN